MTIPIAPPPLPASELRSWPRRFATGVRHPVRWLTETCGGAAVYPLLILFGLNMCDELDRSAFAILLPNIRDDLGVSNTVILSVVAFSGAAALLLTVPIAALADRHNRVRLALLGAAVWAVFSFGTGMAPFVWTLLLVRSGAAIGQGVVFPTHNSLLADYYEPNVRPRVFSFHAAANAIGIVAGTLLGAGLAQLGGWRTPFIVFAIPTAVLVLLGWRMREPVRGRFERMAMGATDEQANIVEPPPSYAEASRMVWKIPTLRRIFLALPFLGASLIGFGALASVQYNETFGLDEVERAFVAVPIAVVQLLGISYGARLATRMFLRGPSHVFKLLAWAGVVSAFGASLFAVAPVLGLAVAANAVIAASLSIVGPGILSSLALAVPPRARSVGFSIGALFILPGLAVIPLIGWIGDNIGVRWGMLLLTPVFLVGAFVISSVSRLIDADIAQVWSNAAVRAELLFERRQGRQKLMLVRHLDVAYGDVQVLFDVDFEIDEGEIVALLGTNGAGKSTLLKAIAGVVEADRGAVVFDGRDITHAPPDEIAALGIAQVPGGQGIFGSLTVADNLRVAGWLERRDRAAHQEQVDRVFERFPILLDRLDEPAADLSGGQQQMLALSMAFLSRPRLLVIDELSIGLAPIVVDQLLDIVRDMRDQGTTVIIVEQSVNVALEIAETAYFMEKGEIRFRGPTADLLARPDILRSVFLQGASRGLGAAGSNGSRATPPIAAATGVVGDEPSFERAGVDEVVVRGNGADVGHDGEGRGREPSGGPDAMADGRSGAGAVPALAVSHLTVRFGGIRAVDDVSFELAQGEVLGIIGPNGAGKTTLFDLVSGFTQGSTGRVELGGVDVTGRRPDGRARLGLGRSFQDARLFPSLTVEDAIAVAFERWVDIRDPLNAVFRLPAYADSETEVRAEVDRLIDLMGIDSFRTKFVSELSTGSRRIVDLACTLAHRPSVILLDEPSSGIAQREAEALGPLVVRIRETLDASVLIIEHDMALITSIADRLLALDRGRLIAAGPPAEVLAHPAVVASYLGTGAPDLTPSTSSAGS
jgi:branched-chain amino acid transport system ATP-binding protein